METFTRAEEPTNRDMDYLRTGRKHQEALSFTPELANGSDTDVDLDLDDDVEARGGKYRG
jgi:hypothetical protein